VKNRSWQRRSSSSGGRRGIHGLWKMEASDGKGVVSVASSRIKEDSRHSSSASRKVGLDRGVRVREPDFVRLLNMVQVTFEGVWQSYQRGCKVQG
jgi:hypothetical protein